MHITGIEMHITGTYYLLLIIEMPFGYLITYEQLNLLVLTDRHTAIPAVVGETDRAEVEATPS